MGLINAIGNGLAEAGGAAEKIGMEQIRATIEADRQARLMEFKATLGNTLRKNQADEIRQGVGAEINKQYGNQDNALETDDTSPVRKPSRAESLQVRHDVAADLGYGEAAADALKARDTEIRADYYGGRGRLEGERLAQGNRRLDLTEELNDAKIDNLDSKSGLADARTKAVGEPKSLTPMQRVRNAEIDAARRKIEGLDPETIKAKTQRFSATGRENPQYDDQLANRVRLASKRKVGEDDWFDGQSGIGDGPPAASPKAEAADPAKRFAADPTMKGMRMGGMTPQGREVLDSTGKLIGHYR